MLKNYKELFKDNLFLDAVKTKRVCLFLGSGVGFNIGMPDWKGLAEEILVFCLKEKIINRSEQITLLNNKNPIKIISICTQRIKKHHKVPKFNNLLKKLFYDIPIKNYRKNNIYRNISKLYKEKMVLIVQTNYDVMIEKFQSDAEGINRNFYIPYINMGEIPQEKILDSIVYLHGRFSCDKNEEKISSYEDLVLDKEKYNRVYVLENTNEYKRQRKFINYLLENFYIIFLGYSLSDTEIMQMIANKPKTEAYKKIAIIIDTCDIKTMENEFNANFLRIASDRKINTYVYETNQEGIEIGFNKVVEDLTKIILYDTKKDFPLLIYTDPKEVDFG